MDKLIRYAFDFIGLPYRYAGNNPLTGFDCSGLACEIARAGGAIPHGLDLSAQDLAQYLIENSGRMANAGGAGCFAFYGKNWKEINHVAFCIDPYRMIEAGGGDALTKTREDAALKNAFVRVRLIRYRKDFIGVVKPNYSAIGLI